MVYTRVEASDKRRGHESSVLTGPRRLSRTSCTSSPDQLVWRNRRQHRPWVVVDAVFSLLSRWFDNLDFARNDGSVAQVCLLLIATSPLTGRMLPWVLAPTAVLTEEPATT